MKPDLLKQFWAPYEGLMTIEKLSAKLVVPELVLSQEIKFLIPSVALVSNGLTVTAVISVTDDYICEVRMDDVRDDFDLVYRNAVLNYRFERGVHRIVKNAEAIALATKDNAPRPPEDVVIHQYCNVALVHGFMRTEIKYVGPDYADWLQLLLTAIPANVLVASRKGAPLTTDGAGV